MGTDYPRGEVELDPVGFVSRTQGLSRETKEKMFKNVSRSSRPGSRALGGKELRCGKAVTFLR